MSSYTEGQVHQLVERLEAEGFTPGHLTKLGQFPDLALLKMVLDGEAEIKRSSNFSLLKDLVRVDRTVPPTYPSWAKEILHPTFQRVGPAEFDCAKLELWLHDAQKNGFVKGQVIYDHLRSHDILSSCTNLQDLEAIQKKGIAHFRKHFKGRAVFGWKSVVRDGDGDLRVPCLYESVGKVILYWNWLEDDWDSTDPALRFA